MSETRADRRRPVALWAGLIVVALILLAAGLTWAAWDEEGSTTVTTEGATTTAPPEEATTGPAPTEDVSIAFLGDSLTEGVGAPPERGYAWQVAEDLGWELELVDGVGGSGYLVPGAGVPFPERVDGIVETGADVVVVSGGTNDIFQDQVAADVAVAAEDVFHELVERMPAARIVVVGPFPVNPLLAGMSVEMSDAIEGAADAVGVEYVDAADLLDRVDTSRWSEYISEDGIHPNEEGYDLMAQLIGERLTAG
ncbi:SGNH/GDSL hydrolase family protein [Sanguibacter suaedae]|uniref:SGNH/GDSL hydrolase family protein n=1 Tax=Sanguibacter suaedae TaxID=2795737 RepID=A0A934MAY5_9MICO|nr:SGNH/GDSL hydrolase family protein [Sanguibacter suaedae]MBI9116110.1 SGNH/GDSL hydrolase family protein [Sanguibacter suaedae]